MEPYYYINKNAYVFTDSSHILIPYDPANHIRLNILEDVIPEPHFDNFKKVQFIGLDGLHHTGTIHPSNIGIAHDSALFDGRFNQKSV